MFAIRNAYTQKAPLVMLFLSWRVKAIVLPLTEAIKNIIRWRGARTWHLRSMHFHCGDGWCMWGSGPFLRPLWWVPTSLWRLCRFLGHHRWVKRDWFGWVSRRVIVIHIHIIHKVVFCHSSNWSRTDRYRKGSDCIINVRSNRASITIANEKECRRESFKLYRTSIRRYKMYTSVAVVFKRILANFCNKWVHRWLALARWLAARKLWTRIRTDKGRVSLGKISAWRSVMMTARVVLVWPSLLYSKIVRAKPGPALTTMVYASIAIAFDPLNELFGVVIFCSSLVVFSGTSDQKSIICLVLLLAGPGISSSGQDVSLFWF